MIKHALSEYFRKNSDILALTISFPFNLGGAKRSEEKKWYIWRSNTLRYEIIYLARNKSYCEFRNRICHCDLNSFSVICLRIQNLRIGSAAQNAEMADRWTRTGSFFSLVGEKTSDRNNHFRTRFGHPVRPKYGKIPENGLKIYRLPFNH